MAAEEKTAGKGTMATVVATAAVTLAIGVTVAALGGYLTPVEPAAPQEVAAPPEPEPTQEPQPAPRHQGRHEREHDDHHDDHDDDHDDD